MHEGLQWVELYTESSPVEIAPASRGSGREAISYIYCLSDASGDAPVSDDPRNSLRPSGSVMSRPFARFSPLFAR